MELPSYLHERASELLAIESDGADKKRLWAVILNVHPKQDGDQWSITWGENMQDGVSAFGRTPVEAIMNFEKEMYKEIGGNR